MIYEFRLDDVASSATKAAETMSRCTDTDLDLASDRFNGFGIWIVRVDYGPIEN